MVKLLVALCGHVKLALQCQLLGQPSCSCYNGRLLCDHKLSGIPWTPSRALAAVLPLLAGIGFRVTGTRASRAMATLSLLQSRRIADNVGGC